MHAKIVDADYLLFNYNALHLHMCLAYIDVRIELSPHTKDAKYLQKLNRLVYVCM